MHIADILDTKGAAVATVPPDATVAEVVEALATHGIGALVVSTDGARIEGIVSERDVVRRLAHDHDGLLARRVSDIMSSPVVSCAPDAQVADVMATMTAERIRHLPVARDGTLAGIVSIGDVVKATIEQLQRDRKLLEDYISAR